MTNPRLAERYAKSLLDLAKEQGKVNDVYADMKFLDKITKSNRDFVAVLKSPIITEDKKNNIIDAVTKDRISFLTASFIKLLANKGRESNLPEIIYSFIEQYNILKGIHKVKIITATELGDSLKNEFINLIKSSEHIEHVELHTVVDEKLIGGFVMEMDGKLIDSSILRDLRDVKKQFMNNDYIHRLR